MVGLFFTGYNRTERNLLLHVTCGLPFKAGIEIFDALSLLGIENIKIFWLLSWYYCGRAEQGGEMTKPVISNHV